VGSPNKVELKLLSNYASNCNFIIETGGGGKSTEVLAQAAQNNNSVFVSIEVDKNRRSKMEKSIEETINYRNGWSISYEDIIKEGDDLFVRSRYDVTDGRIAMGKKKLMKGEVDLIRKSIDEFDVDLDFFFCDTGEYCGVAEWRIVSNIIKKGGYFAAHDIYFPKSIKCFQAVAEIENSDNWEVVEKTTSSQGLLIARRL